MRPDASDIATPLMRSRVIGCGWRLPHDTHRGRTYSARHSTTSAKRREHGGGTI
jgi:hypothetical protein